MNLTFFENGLKNWLKPGTSNNSDDRNPISNRTSISYQAIVLGIFSGLACFLVLMLFEATREEIELQFRLDQLAGLNQVLANQSFTNDLLASPEIWTSDQNDFQMFTGLVQDQVTAYGVQTSVSGYAGPIVLLVGVNQNQDITGVRILSHMETPGLGDRMEIAKSDWVEIFLGHSLDSLTSDQWQVKKDGGQFDQFTGATITPRAIVKGIYQSLNQIRSKLIQDQTSVSADTNVDVTENQSDDNQTVDETSTNQPVEGE